MQYTVNLDKATQFSTVWFACIRSCTIMYMIGSYVSGQTVSVERAQEEACIAELLNTQDLAE
jgi:hypothetical protein